MITLASLTLASACAWHACGHPEEWRAELPPEVQAAVQRVDQADEKAKKAKEQHERDIKNDIEMGRKYVEEIEKELKLSTDDVATQRLQRIGAEMARIANDNAVTVLWGDPRKSVFPYSFKLVKGEDVNAFSIPGGYIYFYEGLLNFAESDDELAAVIGHEISHAAFRHIATLRKESSKFDWVQLPLLVIAALSRSPDAINALTAGQLAMQGMQSGWSVQAEVASDFGGLQYMRMSKYNPVGTLTFMERLQYRDRYLPKINWGIYQTHPLSDERAQFILRKLNEWQVPIRRSQTTTSLAASAEPLDDGSVALLFGKATLFTFRGPDAGERAQNAVDRVNAFFDAVPELFELGMDGTSLTGRGRILFTVEPDDLPNAEADLGRLVQDAAQSTRKALYDLAYRLWKVPDSPNR